MAKLDPLLDALVSKKADELILRSGERPTFRYGESRRAVSTQPLTAGQVSSLVRELSGEIDTPSFVYQSDSGQRFDCRVESEGTEVEVRVAPRSANAAAEPESTQGETAPAIPVSPPPADVGVTARTARAPAIDRLLRLMIEKGSSDLHLCSGEVPMLRTDGEMRRLENEPVTTAEKAAEILDEIMPERNRREYAETGDTDFAHELPGEDRFRVNIFTDRKGPGAVLRVIPAEILTAEQLGLSDAILELCRLHKGLVLVTGPTGSGKSTTLAAMIDHINRTRNDHIITIEDPIEFVHPNRTCLVNQREIVTHTTGFKTALRAALREDPDIVLVGEMRDLETIAIAIETAETGHLVFGTLHTTTACSTVDRIVDQFPADRQAQIRTMLASSLKGVVSQTLLKKTGGGRVAALEVLIVTAAISNLIREGKTFQIPSLMQTGRNLGMKLLNDALLDLVKQKVVAPEEALSKAVDKTSFRSMLKTAGKSIAPDEAVVGA